jgi:mRNA interferase YafQ
MLKPAYTGSFLKDLKLMEKRRKDLTELETVTTLIVNEQPLPAHCRPHLLHGKKWEGKWECHVENDWLLTYKIDPAAHTVTFHRTGTHSDLFKK